MELDVSFTPIRRYTFGLGKDSVEGHIEFSEASSNLFAHPYGWYSYIKDQVGTIYKIFSHQTHTTATTRHYDTFGNLLSQSGPTKGNLGFQSKYYDQESGINYYYSRYYDSSIGKFQSEDSLRFIGSYNFLNIAGNDPINYVDLYGLWNEVTSPGNNGKVKPWWDMIYQYGFSTIIPPMEWPQNNFCEGCLAKCLNSFWGKYAGNLEERASKKLTTWFCKKIADKLFENFRQRVFVFFEQSTYFVVCSILCASDLNKYFSIL